MILLVDPSVQATITAVQVSLTSICSSCLLLKTMHRLSRELHDLFAWNLQVRRVCHVLQGCY